MKILGPLFGIASLGLLVFIIHLYRAWLAYIDSLIEYAIMNSCSPDADSLMNDHPNMEVLEAQMTHLFSTATSKSIIQIRPCTERQVIYADQEASGPLFFGHKPRDTSSCSFHSVTGIPTFHLR